MLCCQKQTAEASPKLLGKQQEIDSMEFTIRCWNRLEDLVSHSVSVLPAIIFKNLSR